MENLFAKWKDALSKSRKAAIGRLASVFGASEIKPELWEELEMLLIQSDLGLATTRSILDDLQDIVRVNGITHAAELNGYHEEQLEKRLGVSVLPELNAKPTILLLVGVNGSGKTTTIAKLGQYFMNEGKQVLLVGADTFRAAATDQLQIWAERLKLPIISGTMGSDPGAVVYDGIRAAIARQMDIVLVDTAGRLHTRFNLMEELKKVKRVAGKAIEGAPHEVWLVLDATTGQNGIAQARAFKDSVGVTGVILAKLDSSARGGMAFAIRQELDLPILFAGLGEKVDDLTPFDPKAFVRGILAT